MKKKIRKSFNLKDFDEQIKNENSGIYLQRIQDHLVFHPYHLSNLNNSVNEILNTHVGKYCPRLEGILCGYKNINFLSRNGYVCDDSYFIHVDIEADYFLFKPVTEKLLHGVVNKISNDHVGCLVHNIFNVSLPKPKDSEKWIGDSLSINDQLEFKITSTDFDRRLPYIKGEIISILSKSEDEEPSAVDENSSLKQHRKFKKAKKTLFTSPSLQEGADQNHENLNVTTKNEEVSAVDDNLPMKNHKKSKKAKKIFTSPSIQAGADRVENESKDNQNFSLAADNDSIIKRNIDEYNEQSDSPPKKRLKS